MPAALPLSQNVAFRSQDVDELEDYLASGDLLEERKLTLLNKSNSVDAYLSAARLSHLRMMGVHLGADVIARSVPLRVAQIVIPMNGNVIDLTHSDPIVAECGRSALFHMPDQPVKVQWQQNTSALVVRIPAEYFKAVYESLTQEEFSKDLKLRPRIDLTQGAGSSLLNIVKNLVSVTRGEGNHSQQVCVPGLWEELLVTTLLSSDPSIRQRFSNRNNSAPVYGYVKRTTDYILSNIQKPFAAEELVLQSGVSIRTLQSGFRKTYGLGPMAFVRQKKLDGIYRELLESDALGVKISRMAVKWGFQHASHFTRIYKNQFNELPSETLAKDSNKSPFSVGDEVSNVII